MHNFTPPCRETLARPKPCPIARALAKAQPMTIDKTFDFAAIEAKWGTHWESTGAYRPDRPDAEPFTIVNPPPNVTGSLHIGHALDNTLQDILIRHARLQGKDALWVVGTDHAGIATQMVVERQMEAQQDKRSNYSREDFVKKVWEWKEESGGQITGQLRRLGCSMDWDNERFTMDEGFSKAVIKVFVELYNQGLLYRDKRLVNWDPKLKTAISDLEVETREINGKFWHFKYPLEDGSGFIIVATTRPETMLADMAVAVNPSDERYAAMVGKNVRLPITERLIPIVADEHADPELGSGAVKITPGHDFNDFEVGKRAGFKASEMLNMLDSDARISQTADRLIPDDFFELHTIHHGPNPSDIEHVNIGLSREKARDLVVHEMSELGFLERVEDRVIQTPYGDRSGVVIEPWLTDQWYVDAETLAKPAIEAARRGAVNGGFDIVPKSWEKTYFNWMENIQPWCVSRQLWWGHRIPAWYGPKIVDGKVNYDLTMQDVELFVANSEEEALNLARERYSNSNFTYELIENPFEMLSRDIKGIDTSQTIGLWQDSDVLDTWFSSALWPFGTLGWPTDKPNAVGNLMALARDAEQATEAQLRSALNPASMSPEAEAVMQKLSNPLLNRHYPNDVLVSGFDILFFWDARMAMQGLHFMKEVPWKTLYLHGLVRAADGSKMSKSKGNTVDPLGLIDQYGADALRFFMAAMESQGRDIKMDDKRVEGYRNFATKLWNAARFCQSNGIGASHSVAAPKAELAVNKWIIGEVVDCLEKLNRAFAEFRFDGMADAIYHFIWGTFCDWYLELVKPVLGSGSAPSPVSPEPVEGREGQPSGASTSSAPTGSDADETRAVAAWVLDQILVMLHPFMPFITEELWHAMGERGGHLLIHAKWPEPAAEVDVEAKAEVEWLIDLIGEVRAAKNELGISPGRQLSAFIPTPSVATQERITRNEPLIERLARLQIGVFGQNPDGAAINLLVGDATVVIPLGGVVDLESERNRLAKAIEAATKEAKSLEGRLSNPAFVEKAKPEAVEKARADMAEKSAEVERLQAALARLG
jgi:valyl-tRNA synthetase